MPAMVETMFSVREVPWHGLGVVVEEAPNSKEAIKLAGLDWDVVQTPIYVKNNDILESIPNLYANVRSTDNKVLGVVSNRYRVIQNREAFEFTDALVTSGEVRYETAGSLFEGRKIWLLAKLPEEIVLGDKVIPYLVFTNSHDGKNAVQVAITPVRVVCNNTLTMALNNAERTWTTKHIGNLQAKLVEARKTLELTYNYMEKFKEEAEIYAQIHLSDNDAEDIIAKLIPIPNTDNLTHKQKLESLREDLLYRYQHAPDIKRFKGTGWGLINAVSDFISHKEPLRKTNSYKERRFYNLITKPEMLIQTQQLLALVA